MLLQVPAPPPFQKAARSVPLPRRSLSCCAWTGTEFLSTKGKITLFLLQPLTDSVKYTRLKSVCKQFPSGLSEEIWGNVHVELYEVQISPGANNVEWNLWWAQNVDCLSPEPTECYFHEGEDRLLLAELTMCHFMQCLAIHHQRSPHEVKDHLTLETATHYSMKTTFCFSRPPCVVLCSHLYLETTSPCHRPIWIKVDACNVSTGLHLLSAFWLIKSEPPAALFLYQQMTYSMFVFFLSIHHLNEDTNNSSKLKVKLCQCVRGKQSGEWIMDCIITLSPAVVKACSETVLQP